MAGKPGRLHPASTCTCSAGSRQTASSSCDWRSRGSASRTALAQVELLREEAVKLITQKNLARWRLETAIKEGVPPERIAAYRAEYEPLQAQVDEIKERCRQIEINARELTEKWLAEQKDED